MRIVSIATANVSGGPEFIREQLKATVRWRELGYSVDAYQIQTVDKFGIRRRAIKILNGYTAVDVVAIFAHGTTTQICGLGVDEVSSPAMANALMQVGVSKVVLYSCSTSRRMLELPWSKKEFRQQVDKMKVTDGIANIFAADFCEIGHGVEIIAHTSAGHTTRNPYVTSTMTLVNSGEIIRRSLAPADKWKPWVEKMKTDWRFEMPMLNHEQIAEAFK